ncbi:MAG TPA: methylmalonyl-CoA mutase family protein [Caulobacteraceae bacterium]|nr:methylmalonyl-CoA mutase family protein [Caulobacteraceae bacterium]
MNGPAASTEFPLAAAFEAPERGEWLALVERTLKGAPLASLTRRTLEGLEIAPLYEPSRPAPAPARSRRGWDVRTLVRASDPDEANREVLEDLAGGAQSVLLRLDPTGAHGVAAASPEALARVLDGVVLEVAQVALDAGFLAAQAADWLAAAARGAPAARLALHMDPLGAFAATGVSPGPLEAHLAACAGVGARLAEPYPEATFFLASGRTAHEAGAGEAAELALACASALAYAKALARAGLTAQGAFARIVLGLAADADCFLVIAKLRAARILWSKLTGACGVAAAARIEARSSARMLTSADPWNNMIRLTCAGFAAAVGGADAVVLGAFTDPLGAPTAFARRQARNAQLVLEEEASLGRIIDPAAGSAYIETLTDQLAREAWTRLQTIEAAGGVSRALEGGLVATWAELGRTELARRIAARELKVLGVTDFLAADDSAPELAATSWRPSEPHPPELHLPGPESRCPTLAPIRLESLA